MKLLGSALYERIGREAVVLTICFLLAEAVNVVAILAYQTEWRELYSQIGWLILFTLGFYALSIPLRVLAPRLLRRKTG